MTKKEYTPALGFDWLSIWYDLTIKLTMPERKFRRLLIEYLSPKSGERILEFGFGTGSNLILAASQNTDIELIGLDIDPKIKRIASKKLLRNNIDIPLQLYDGSVFPFEDNSFDKVFSCLVFHQLADNKKAHALNEINRVLKPGGKLIIGDWGKANSPWMRFSFYAVQLLDGFNTTHANVMGALPKFIKEAEFEQVFEAGSINTSIGTFSYYEAVKKH